MSLRRNIHYLQRSPSKYAFALEGVCHRPWPPGYTPRVCNSKDVSPVPESLSEPRPLTQAAIFRCLEQGAHLITANLRLSRFFQQRFASHAAATGRPVWLAPLILPQKDWLLQLRERLLITGQLAARTVLNPEQERLLWEEIIRNSPEGENLLRPRATARQVAEAWTLLHDWQLDFPAAVSDGNEDTEAFANWCRAFRRRCAQADWISMAEIPASLSAALAEAGSAANPLAGQTLLLAGFDELVPAARTLFERLAASGSEVRWLLPEAVAEAGTRGLVECADEHEEIRLMARWARQQVETRPGGTVAVVVPDLSARREAIVTALSALLPGEGNSALFNVSLGLPLNRYSLVQTAFDLLSLLPRRRLEPATASALLLSPFVAGWEAESRSRALLDRRLRETGEVRISLRRLIRLASQADRPWHCPELAAHLQALESHIGDLPERETAAGWMQLFSRCLGAAGWPAGRGLDSREYQCFEAWQKALSGFAQLQEVAGQFDLRRALAGLRQLVGERI
ncbi:MAG TPA: hypothetical protein ENK40_05220, partial [Gammaproteobacteria bacterium]|nr:hypothetical protein [Gammaproteobacteria bacterium]